MRALQRANVGAGRFESFAAGPRSMLSVVSALSSFSARPSHCGVGRVVNCVPRGSWLQLQGLCARRQEMYIYCRMHSDGMLTRRICLVALHVGCPCCVRIHFRVWLIYAALRLPYTYNLGCR